MKKDKNKEQDLNISTKVFISYSHSDKMNEYFKEIRDSLNIDLKGELSKKMFCDRLNLKHKGEIYDLIGEKHELKYFVLLMNDSFFKSDECMFALNELVRAKKFRNKCFPILIKDSDIFNNEKRNQYVEYWEEEINSLNAKIEDDKSLEDEILFNINKCSINKISINYLFNFLKEVNTLQEENEEKFRDVISILNKNLKTKIEIDTEFIKIDEHEE